MIETRVQISNLTAIYCTITYKSIALFKDKPISYYQGLLKPYNMTVNKLNNKQYCWSIYLKFMLIIFEYLKLELYV